MDDIPLLTCYSWFYDSTFTRELVEQKFSEVANEDSNFYVVRVKDGDKVMVRCVLSIQPGLYTE